MTGEVSAWEIINLRPVRGGWRPVGRKPVEIIEITGTALHMHLMDTVHNLISIDNSTLYFKNLETGKTKQIARIEGSLLDINSLGGVLIVSTTARKYEYTYNWNDNIYDLFPEWEEIQISIEVKTDNKKLEEANNGRPHTEITSALLTEYNKYHLEQRIKGKTIGCMVVRYAIELLDGTYIYPSCPVEILLPPGTGGIYVARSMQLNWPDSVFMNTGVSWISVQFPTELGNFLNRYSDTIAGIALFGTTPRNMFENEVIIHYGEQYAYLAELPLSVNVTDNLIKSEAFNLLQRFTIDEIINAGNNSVDILPDYEILDSQEKLIIEDEKLHNVRHATSLVYNGRLLTGNISTQLFDGWDLFNFTEVMNYWFQVIFEFEIKTSFGIKKVQRRRRRDWIYFMDLPRLISYPDIRAVCVNIYLQDDDFYKVLSKKMKPHPTQNFAYCFLREETKITDTFKPGFTLVWNGVGWEQIPDPVLPLDSATFTDPNRVQASEVDNPVTMPYKNSYQVGNSSVLGFAVNGEPVSEGQFGQYPVYVFTGEGIYMMDVGVDPFISSVRQINGEICNSPKTIKNIGIGVLFTTDKGLMVINSLQVNTLSSDFEQEAHNDYAVRRNELYKKAIGLTGLGNPGRFVSTVPFINYLSGANIGYDYPNREIWVNNPAYLYSYVFSMDYKVWSKRDETFTTIVDDYPRYYAQQGKQCKNLSAKESVENMNIFLLSNPIKINPNEFKQFRRIVARGEFPVERMGLYLFGSIDGFSWAYTGGKEIVSPMPPSPTGATAVVKARDAIYLGAHKSAKYAAAVIEGVVTHEWNLTHISETAESVINKKLR
jgi:hypothetical protein